jgi:hypothetical protein
MGLRLGLVLLVGLVLHAPGARAEDPAVELTRALQGLGPPGLLWGRLAVEEESPEGPTTPLAGVEVVAYPYIPSLAADLARIRESARGSGTEYESAVARLQERLKAFEAQVTTLGPRPAPDPDHALVRRRTTDTSGIFVVEGLPSGEWLLVVVHLTPYSQGKDLHPRPSPIKKGVGDLGGGFLTRPRTPAKEAEVWVTRVRVAPGEGTRALLTDRSRFMVGPLR